MTENDLHLEEFCRAMCEKHGLVKLAILEPDRGEVIPSDNAMSALREAVLVTREEAARTADEEKKSWDWFNDGNRAAYNIALAIRSLSLSAENITKEK